MLQELPKKDKNYANPTKAQLFWRSIGECLRRAIMPFLMYFVMGVVAFSLQMLSGGSYTWWGMALGILTILLGAFYDGYLCYSYSRKHYEVYLTGELHRLNEKFGIQTGGDYRAHQEYRPWKGFLIGLFAGAFVILFGIISIFTTKVEAMYMLLSGWALSPVLWARQLTGNTSINGGWSLLMLLVPILVSGAFYLLGAWKRKREKESADARKAEVERILAEQKQKRAEQNTSTQTEEQRRKTAQSKKKK